MPDSCLRLSLLHPPFTTAIMLQFINTDWIPHHHVCSACVPDYCPPLSLLHPPLTTAIMLQSINTQTGYLIITCAVHVCLTIVPLCLYSIHLLPQLLCSSPSTHRLDTSSSPVQCMCLTYPIFHDLKNEPNEITSRVAAQKPKKQSACWKIVLTLL